MLQILQLLLLLLLLFFYHPSAQAFDREECKRALGVESGAIADEDIRASSSFDSGNVGPQHARVRTETGGGAWCPRDQITVETKEWLEIDLKTVHVITGTESQGRFGNGQGQEFAEFYLLEYWRPALNKWVRYRTHNGTEILEGNSNTYLEKKTELDPPIWASKLRFYPYSSHMRTVCMRVEIYGCPWTEGVVSYSMPQGDKRGSAWQFFDATYDGYWDKELQRGLGELTDGKIGPDSFKMAYDYGRGVGWVGWKNDSRGNQPIEIKFEFDKVREFNSLHIYCNNEFTKDIQVFGELKIWFSVGGVYYSGEPLSYTYMEDRIFEYSRNVSVKLHRRVGRYLKLELYFANRWIMISEISFDSIIARGNFTPESPPQEDDPFKKDGLVDKKRNRPQSEIPLSKEADHRLMGVLIGVLSGVVLVLSGCILLMVTRHRQRKCFSSPLNNSTSKSPHPGGTLISSSLQHPVPPSCYTPPPPSAPPDSTSAPLLQTSYLKATEEYQEPYHPPKYTPYYSPVISDRSGSLDKPLLPSGVDYPEISHEYAVPEVPQPRPLLTNGSLPILYGERDIPSRGSTKSEDGKRKKTATQDLLTSLKKRLEEKIVPEFPRHRLRMISQLGEGAFGSVYIAEADGIPEYGLTTTLGKRMVAVKFLLSNASEKEKFDFKRDVKILSALDDNNLSRVLGVCWNEEPYCVIMEYLEFGDLHQFLRAHVLKDSSSTVPIDSKCLRMNDLLYMATQIASGMRCLESLNFVHRDLAARNILVGNGYHVKISDFGTDNDAYAADYYKVDGNLPIPVRWMPWEAVFMGKYSTKSDVWSFGVLLCEMMCMCAERPFNSLSDEEVVAKLGVAGDNCRRKVKIGGEMKSCCSELLELLLSCSSCSSEVRDLISDCLNLDLTLRPTFYQIHLFLKRKTLHYIVPLPSSSASLSLSS